MTPVDQWGIQLSIITPVICVVYHLPHPYLAHSSNLHLPTAALIYIQIPIFVSVSVMLSVTMSVVAGFLCETLGGGGYRRRGFLLRGFFKSKTGLWCCWTTMMGARVRWEKAGKLSSPLLL
ncbi:hypothetical protein M8C21_033324 [Ambrosia artemisiifolia]|uniref:Uncharacterized protein n=1 Tax=Ambrosia artemisiifolia TaxID=4212 RepID=A0AAD5GLA4_AMBAR|nr:hypothetical protein M8C21_033324 [Ambrosia artemisiifolia]